MRLLDRIPFLVIFFTFFLSACGKHEWSEEMPQPPTPSDYVPIDLQLNFAFDRAELPDYRTITVEAARASVPLYEIRYQVRIYRMGADSFFETLPCETFSFSHAEVNELGYQTLIKLREGRYRFMVWADFIEAGSKVDLFYDTADFASIALRRETYIANSDYRDAFRGVLEADLQVKDNGASEHETLIIDMRRPLAKFRFIATDVEEFKDYYLRSILQSALLDLDKLKDEIDMTKFRVVFSYSGFMPYIYNMYTDRPVDVRTGVSFSSTLTDIKDGEAMMGFDYIMVGNGDAGVSLSAVIYDEKGKQLSGINNIEVPLQRGKLTTVRGNFLTSRSSGNIQIDSSFDGEFDIEIK